MALMKEKLLPKDRLLAFGVSVVVLGAFGYGGYSYWQLTKTVASLSSELSEATTTLEAKVAENISLQSALEAEQRRNNDFQDQIEGISSTVTKIDKLQQTDPQLLAKYSKVYFLPDNYIPKDLVSIASSSTYADSKNYQLIGQADRHLEEMIRDAKSDGINLLVISAYRSFNSQASLKVSYKFTYGSGANAFSADQGYSEHQLGTTIDFTTKELGPDFSTFAKSPAYDWLTKHAYKYGFVISYPSGNTYYISEPWHWRFVGINLAQDLHDQNKYFYQLDQRTINNYLIDFANDR